jgi:hypothetical protein
MTCATLGLEAMSMSVTAALGTGVESHNLSTTFVLWNLFRGLLRSVFAGSNGVLRAFNASGCVAVILPFWQNKSLPIVGLSKVTNLMTSFERRL